MSILHACMSVCVCVCMYVMVVTELSVYCGVQWNLSGGNNAKV